MRSFSILITRLRLLRVRHALTQDQFAEIAGMGYKFYQQIESGRKKQIWLETVDRLAHAFGIETWQLIGPEVPANTSVRSRPRANSVLLAAESVEMYHPIPQKNPRPRRSN